MDEYNLLTSYSKLREKFDLSADAVNIWTNEHLNYSWQQNSAKHCSHHSSITLETNLNAFDISTWTMLQLIHFHLSLLTFSCSSVIECKDWFWGLQLIWARRIKRLPVPNVWEEEMSRKLEHLTLWLMNCVDWTMRTGALCYKGGPTYFLGDWWVLQRSNCGPLNINELLYRKKRRTHPPERWKQIWPLRFVLRKKQKLTVDLRPPNS